MHKSESTEVNWGRSRP